MPAAIKDLFLCWEEKKEKNIAKRYTTSTSLLHDNVVVRALWRKGCFESSPQHDRVLLAPSIALESVT